MNERKPEMLTTVMRDFLIKHIDGSSTVPVDFVVCNSAALQTARAAIEHGWVKLDGLRHPKRSFITDKGREILAGALADWADALVRAGYDGPTQDRTFRWHPRSIFATNSADVAGNAV